MPPPLIQQLDRRSVHHLQSGQVINEGLTSAVKELVENALDANATSIEVRFKNYGLESIEVIDNGDGVAPENYETLALKHYTSKLREYSDLETVSTFGFRGEALSSLCALSDLTITTARACDAPKGVKLVFEGSGKLKSQNIVAASKGTSVCSANLFKTLPVRRKELERNIKREYAKVLGYLQAYACICVNVKFSVFNQPIKGKRTAAFATKGNPTTRENISNVFGSKSLAALVPLDLEFEMTPTLKGALAKAAGVAKESRTVKVVGHISRPVVGEGRNAPDRQMFFVNGRPCNLPQISKAINEVYKGFNVTQSPFIFADIQLDTDAYDVNVSPDKRTILLHDQADLLENLKGSLQELFEQQDQTVPMNQIVTSQRLRQLSLNGFSSSQSTAKSPSDVSGNDSEVPSSSNEASGQQDIPSRPGSTNTRETENLSSILKPFKPPSGVQSMASSPSPPPEDDETEVSNAPQPVSRTTSQVRQRSPSPELIEEEPIPSSQIPATQHPPVTRSPRKIDSSATITIGNRSPVTSGPLPPSHYAHPSKRRKTEHERTGTGRAPMKRFVSALDRFRAPGTQASQVERSSRREDTDDDDGQYLDKNGMIKEEDTDEEDDAGLEVLREIERNDNRDVDGEPEDSGNAVGSGPEVTLSVISQRDENGPLFPHNMPPDTDDEAEMSESANNEVSGPPDETVDTLSAPQDKSGMEDGAPGLDASPPGDIAIEDDSDGDFVPPAEVDTAIRQRAARRLHEAEAETASSELPSAEILTRAATILRGSRDTCTHPLVRTISPSLSAIQSTFSCLSLTPNPTSKSTPSSELPTSDDSDQAAETRLTLTISKSDFFQMRIKGQFNLGFILATRDDELFIIDQHASDEKYNFETLQLLTTVSPQPLAVPKPLDLMAMDEIAVISNLPVFRKNGFIVEVDEDEIPGRKCRLMSVPMSKDTVFGMKDFEELVHLVHQHPGGGAGIRPAKVRAMFAMRACRKSVMVGKALQKKQMERIVRHMGELDKPWNCPHGRPTMRHLADLGTLEEWEEYGEEKLDWGDQWQANVERLRELQEEEREREMEEADAMETAGLGEEELDSVMETDM